MLKIVEIKETTDNSNLVDNIYSINKTVKNIIKDTEFIFELNCDDYNYLNIILQKTRKNLDVVYAIINKNKENK